MLGFVSCLQLLLSGVGNSAELMKKVLKYISIGVMSIPLLYGLWLLLRAFLFDFFSIPTYSMYPTLKPGDEVIVNRLLMGARIYEDFHFDKKGIELKSWRTKGIRSIRHNDIVVFNFPHHDWKISFIINHVYCKRVIALGISAYPNLHACKSSKTA